MRMKVDLSAFILGLDGKKAGDHTLGKILAGDLVSTADGPAIKFYDWAVKLYDGGVIEVDAADLEVLKKRVESSQGLTVLTKAQLLKALNLARDAS